MRHPNQDPERLRLRRLEAGLTQTALADRADVTKSHVCQVENGKARFGPQRLVRIARALGCTIADLLTDVDETAGAA